MIKILTAVLFTFFSSSTLLAYYAITLTNQTDKDFTATIRYAGAGVCSADNLVLNAKDNRTKDAKFCCTQVVEFTPVNGGKKIVYQPPRTGFNISCRSYSATLKQAGGNFVVESN